MLANEVLGDHIFGKFIANKEKEWDLFRTYVTDFEINRYLPMSLKNGKGQLETGCPFFYKAFGKRGNLRYKNAAGAPLTGHPHTLV